MALIDYFRRSPTAPASSGQAATLGVGYTDAELEAAARVDPEIEVGRSGVLNYRGFLQPEEYNLDLRPPKSFKVYDRMSLSDPTVRATLMHVTTPLRAADWDVVPGGDTDRDLEVAAAVRSAFFEWPYCSWDDILVDCLRYLVYGNMVMEEVWEHRTVGWSYNRPGQGNPVIVPPRDMLVFSKFGPRLPKTIYRWIVDSAGELAVIQQRAYFPGAPGNPWKISDIPADKCTVFTNDKIGDDYWGISLLRGAYKPWWMLEALQRVTSIGMERYHVGTPMARMTSNASVAQRNKVLQSLMDLRSGEMTGLVYSAADGLDCDHEAEQRGRADHAIWILQPDTAPPDSVPYIQHLEGNIFTNIMARFMDLGQKETGARATAEIQDDPFYLGLLAVANYVCDRFNRGAIRRFCDVNFPGLQNYPKMRAEKIERQDSPIIARAVQSYAAVGFITPDFPTEQAIRRSLRLPEKIFDADDVDYDPEDAVNQKNRYPSVLGLQQQALDIESKQVDAMAAAGAAGGSAQPPQLPRTTAGLPRADAAVRDSGGGTALTDDPDVLAAAQRVATRLLREATAAMASGDTRRVLAVRSKDVGPLAQLIGGVGATKWAMQMQTAAQTVALDNLGSDDEGLIRKVL